MKPRGKYLYVLATCFLGFMSPLKAQSLPSSPATKHWDVELKKKVLTDHSVLMEFEASTASKNVDGAHLSIAFIPRFKCSPLISVRIVERESGFPVNSLTLRIDDKQNTYPVIVDNIESEDIYTISGSPQDRTFLRKLLDQSIKASVWIIRPLDQTRNVKVNVAVKQYGDVLADFSLLGSRRAAFLAERQCKSYQPAAAN
jgi:hypothetical protein